MKKTIMVLFMTISLITVYVVGGCAPTTEPVVDEPVVDEPVVDEPEPVVDEPVVDEPEPVVDEPAEEPLELVDVTWISPRGSLEGMGEFAFWVADEMGYFEELGINLIMEPGPDEALATTKFTAEGHADVGLPSPGVLVASRDEDVDVTMVFNTYPAQVFNFAVHEDSDIVNLEDVEGKTISVMTMGWADAIIAPLLGEIGVDPDSVEYVAAGAMWPQMVAVVQADVALGWAGYTSHWEAMGLPFRYFYGHEFSEMPGNGNVVRRADLDDPEKVELYQNFFKALSMGYHFAANNPRAAAQINYEKFPALGATMAPGEALGTMVEYLELSIYGPRQYGGWGGFPMESWDKYLDLVYEMGTTRERLVTEHTVNDILIEEANNFDESRVEQDAESFELGDLWNALDVPDF